jgi:hypothetical protein
MKKYYLKKRNILFLSGVSALPVLFAVLIFGYLILSEPNPSWVITLFIFVIPLEIIHSIWMVFSIYLVISGDGIKYNLYNRAVTARWIETEGISRTTKIENLIINKPPYNKANFLFSLFPSNALKKIKTKSYIPLSWFADNWRDSELGQQIRQYAPHLFEKEKPT